MERNSRRRIGHLAVAGLVVLTLAGCSGPAPGGTWSGTITVTRTGDATQSSDDGQGSKETTRRLLNDVVTIQVANGRANGRVSYNYEEHLVSRQAHSYGDFDITSDTLVNGSGADSSRTTVRVALDADGTYEIDFSTPGVDGTWQRSGRSVLTCRTGPPACSPADTQSSDSAPAPGLSGATDVLEGRINPSGPRVLAGSLVVQTDLDGGLAGETRTTWDLALK